MSVSMGKDLHFPENGLSVCASIFYACQSALVSMIKG